MGRFDGRVFWITGGGSGLGRAMALELARQGADVAVSGRRAERLDEVAAEIDALGRRGLGVVCDVCDESSCAEAVQAVVAGLGKLDGVIANAGFGVTGTIDKLTDADWRRQFDTNVFGLLNTVRAAMPQLRATGGRVVLIGSVSSFFYARKNGPYNASKAAVRAIGETLSAELAGTDVTCTTIHPGFVESEIGQVDNEGVFHPDKKDKRPANLMWKTDDAARVMVQAIHARKREFVFTGHGKVITALTRLMPGAAAALARRF